MKSRWKTTEELAKQANEGGIGIVENDMKELQTKLEKEGVSPAALIKALEPLRKKRKKLRQARHTVRVVTEINAKNTLANFKWNELPLDQDLVELTKSVAHWQSSSEEQTKIREEDERLEQEREIKLRLEKKRLEKSGNSSANASEVAAQKIKLQEWNKWEAKRLEEDELKKEQMLETQQQNATKIQEKLERTGRPPTDAQKEVIFSADRVWTEPPRPALTDVSIYWADQADLELAQTWPAHVRHEWMGILTRNYKYVAPPESQMITELPSPMLQLQAAKSNYTEEPISEEDEQLSRNQVKVEAEWEGKAVESNNSQEQYLKKSWWERLPLASRFKGTL
jgi:hypothetical protein